MIAGRPAASDTRFCQADRSQRHQALYPEIDAQSDNVIALMQPIYVRTNKEELGLPPKKSCDKGTVVRSRTPR
jgi:hypothetical protein